MTRKRKSAPPKRPPAKPRKETKPKFSISATALARASVKKKPAIDPGEGFKPPKFPPGAVPKGSDMAMDDALVGQGSAAFWAANGLGGLAFAEGWQFLGYQYLAQLAQIPEYRCMSEIIATEMTRKWITFEAVGDEDKTERIKQLDDEFKRLRVQACFREIAEQDGFFGRAHLYLDLGTTDQRDELLTPIGDGWNDISKSKVKRGGLKHLQTVEAMWCYPQTYNASDPLKQDFYKPQSWFALGKQLHMSRLLTFVGREVPDLLKPAYAFGGLALSQMAKPYIDIWLRNRQSASDILYAFTVWVLATDLMTLVQGDGHLLADRLEMFNRLRSNQGVMAINKESEEFKNVTASLATIDALVAQSQEHMSAVSRIPLVKLLGIQPAGLNASSEGEIRTFYDTIGAYQERFFRPNLHRVLGFVMLSLWGEVDPAITFKFEPLWSLDEKGEAEVRKTDAETDQIYTDMGVTAPEEVRKKVAGAPGSPYAGLDPDDVPDLLDEEEHGLAPRGAGGAVKAELDDGEPEKEAA